MRIEEFEARHGKMEDFLKKCDNLRAFGGSCNCVPCRLKRQMANPQPAHSPDSAYCREKMASHSPDDFVFYNGFVLWIQ